MTMDLLAISPLERETTRAALMFEGKIPLLPDELAKIKWFLYGSLGATAVIVLLNLTIWRK